MSNKLIDSIQFLIDLTPKEVDHINQLFKKKEIKKGDYFLADGQVCRQVGFIVKGLVRYYINDDGEEKTYDFGKENSFVCNYESFLPQTPSKKIIQALEDCEMLVISFADLQIFYKSVKGAERFGRLVIEQVFTHLLKALSSLYTETPEYRYKIFVEEHPDLLLRISQYHIASYVGVKPQSLSRIRKRMSGQK